ncbi:MAG: MarR family transcriptional regulator [Chloroflexota bacterium]
MARLKDMGVLAWLYMMRVTDKLHRLEGEHLAKYDLTPAQFGVLAHLIANEGITQQALSERLFVTKGNVCGLIGRLEERGLVQRESDPEDRRSNLLHLTVKGRELAERVVPANEQFISEYMSTLTVDEQHTLRNLLRRLDKSIIDESLVTS